MDMLSDIALSLSLSLSLSLFPFSVWGNYDICDQPTPTRRRRRRRKVYSKLTQ